MAASDRAASARAAADSLLAKPAVQRAIQDPAVRDEARVAYEEARDAFERVRGSKHGVASSLLDDKKTQNALKAAGAAGLAIATALHEGPEKPKKRRWGRLVLLALVGGALAIALSEGLRNKILDLLFGAEEEFDYVSTTAPPVAPQAPGADGGVGQAAETTAEAGETTAQAAAAAAHGAAGEAQAETAETAEDAAKDATEEAGETS